MKRMIAACTATLSLALLLPATQSIASSGAAVVNEQRMAHISVVRQGDQGTPVIMIPGLATPCDVWGGVAGDLAKRHRVYLVQVNGFGGDTPGNNLDKPVLSGIVSDLHTLITRDKLQGVAVVGHSLGGLVALLLGRDHPGDAGRLMIVDALPFYGVLATPPGSDATVAGVEPFARAMRDSIAAQYGKPVDITVIERQTKGLTRSPAAAKLVNSWAAKSDPRVTAKAIYEDIITDLRGELGTIKAAITVVYPWAEGRFSAEQTAMFYRTQYRSATQIKVVEIKEAAHFVMLDQPSAFSTALKEFLD